MKEYAVLSRDETIRKNTLIEASAGTGKTFSIEQIVLRLLVEEPPLELPEIAVMTFTKAAAKELKQRIWQTLYQTASMIQANTFEKLPDWFPKEISLINSGYKKIQNALLQIDQAAIFTIHSFCHHLLTTFPVEGGIGGEDLLDRASLNRLVHDFFRTDLFKIVTRSQLEALLNDSRGEFSKLEDKIKKSIESSFPFPDSSPISCFISEYTQIITTYRSQWNREQAEADLERIFSLYKGIHTIKKEIKPEILKAKEQFLHLLFEATLDEEHYEQWLANKFSPERICIDSELKKGVDQPNTPLDALQKELYPLLSNDYFFLRLASHCAAFVNESIQYHEHFRYDDLLNRTVEASQSLPFQKAVRSRFKGVIVDEFQDTDPKQWAIIKNLFLNPLWEGNVHLVGDPKQSIYGFRQADIYTYLEAVDTIGDNNRVSLATNYRSTPEMIDGLNHLFSAPNLFALPNHDKTIRYHQVKAGIKESSPLPAITFLMNPPHDKKKLPLKQAEQDYFFPIFAEKIQQLKTPLNEIAFLVADRYQGERLGQYFESVNIPYLLQRGEHLINSAPYSALVEALKSAAHLQQSDILKFLAGDLIGWKHEQLLDYLNDFQIQEEVISHLIELKTILFQKGFPIFFQKLLDTIPKIRKGGVQDPNFYTQLEEVGGYICSLETIHRPYALLQSLEKLSEEGPDEGEWLTQKDPLKEGIKIITLHACKGLEYSIVFTPGLIRRPPKPSQLIPVEHHRKKHYQFTQKDEKNYRLYCDQLDAEKLRLFYVALTRAKTKLFCPVLIEKNTPDLGCASPMELYFAKWGETPGTLSKERVESLVYHPSIEVIEVQKGACEPIYPNNLIEKKAPQLKNIEPKLSFPLHTLSSFTSLRQHSFPLQTLRAPVNFEEPYKTEHTLPASATTGILLHKLLECIPFSKGKKGVEGIKPLIAPYVRATPFEPWIEVIANMLYQALNTPLPFGCCLCEIEESAVLKETEFLYLENGQYIKGIIDLVVIANQQLHIIDWKSNWLGIDETHYSNKTLTKAIDQHHYQLQADLYKKAMTKQINALSTTLTMGNVCYLFLRGLPNEGIIIL